MERERIIWRPNGIPLEAWNAKTRDEQIAWWRENESTTAFLTKQRMIDVPELYAKGIVTNTDFFILVCKRATDAEMPEFLQNCPDQLLALLRQQLQDYAGDDPARWPRTIHAGSSPPWVTREEFEKSQDQQQHSIWNGVAILKSHLEDGG